MDNEIEITPEMAQAVHDYFENLKNNICVLCKQPLTGKEQIGRCVYGQPCRHRQYQGTLPQEDAEEEARQLRIANGMEQ